MVRAASPVIAIAGPKPDALLRAARRLSPMTTILVPPGTQKPGAVTDAQWREAGEGAAFLCIGQRCTLPIRDASLLRQELFALLQQDA